MFYLVSYDIPETKRRGKIARVLKDYGRRVQLSVFECTLDDERIKKMVGRLEKLVAAGEDSIRIYDLCSECKGKIIVLGGGAVVEEPIVYIL
jgi:CRISPR-associated protein Cas2